MFKNKIKDLLDTLNLLCDFLSHPMEPQNAYFSFKRRNFYLCLAFVLFIIEMVIIILFFSPVNKYIKLIGLITALVILKFSIKFEKFSMYIKELDRMDIKNNINKKIADLEGKSIIEFLTELEIESEAAINSLRSEVNSPILVNLVNTIISFLLGYFIQKTSIAIGPILLVLLFVLYLYFVLDIIKTSKSYLLELYEYQIKFLKRLKRGLGKDWGIRIILSPSFFTFILKIFSIYPLSINISLSFINSESPIFIFSPLSTTAFSLLSNIITLFSSAFVIISLPSLPS